MTRPLQPQHSRGRSVPCMNNNTHSLPIESEHPQPGGDCVRVAPQPDTEKRKVEGNNSDTARNSHARYSAGPIPPPKAGRCAMNSPAGGGFITPATGGAVSHIPALSLQFLPVELPRLASAGRGFSGGE